MKVLYLCYFGREKCKNFQIHKPLISSDKETKVFSKNLGVKIQCKGHSLAGCAVDLRSLILDDSSFQTSDFIFPNKD